ncbi:MAG: hypothetical protein KF796_19515 [Ramlibacter sp.]|nr:hypothetical protein [Ramlibacter sp.]
MADLQQHANEMRRIANEISRVIAKEQHAVTLDALMLVYKSLALHFPCCTRGCATQAWATAQELAQASNQPSETAGEADPSARPARHLH